MIFNTNAIKPSELPEGTIIEIQDLYGRRERYEKSFFWNSLNPSAQVMSFADVDALGQVRIVSVPFEVTLTLATWLDNVFTKHGKPESLIVEAGQESKKTKDDAHISDRPHKG